MSNKKHTNGGNGTAPKFDFSGVSYKWNKQYTRAEIDMLHSENGEDYEERVATRDRLLCQVLVDVPREWLVKNAPDNIDWSDPANLEEYLQSTRITALMTALREALQADNASGN